MKIAVVTDSTAYIPKEMREEHHIHMIPLQVVFGENIPRRNRTRLEKFYKEVKIMMSCRLRPSLLSVN